MAVISFDLFGLVICGLSTWRLSYMIANEDGPQDIFSKIRIKIGHIYYNEQGQKIAKNLIGKIMICIPCSSVWIGGFIFLCYLLFWPLILLLLVPTSLSALAILIENWRDKIA